MDQIKIDYKQRGNLNNFLLYKKSIMYKIGRINTIA